MIIPASGGLTAIWTESSIKRLAKPSRFEKENCFRQYPTASALDRFFGLCHRVGSLLNSDLRWCLMSKCTRKWICLFLIASFFAGAQPHAAETVFSREDFEKIDKWEPLFFQAIDRHTQYSVEKQDGSYVLTARSDNSASAIVCKQTFNVAEFPIIRWRWKVDRVYAKGDYRSKSGDDYPIRVYVLFAFDPETAGIGMKLKYGIVKTLYGRYPPHSTLNYIWANRPNETEAVASPFTDRSIMIPLRRGPEKAGQWVEETVNVLEDYRRFFGVDPPPQAALAIMNDSDNTGGNATSYIEFIEVLKTAEPH